jgi:hypothetical protein
MPGQSLWGVVESRRDCGRAERKSCPARQGRMCSDKQLGMGKSKSKLTGIGSNIDGRCRRFRQPPVARVRPRSPALRTQPSRDLRSRTERSGRHFRRGRAQDETEGHSLERVEQHHVKRTGKGEGESELLVVMRGYGHSTRHTKWWREQHMRGPTHSRILRARSLAISFVLIIAQIKRYFNMGETAYLKEK